MNFVVVLYFFILFCVQNLWDSFSCAETVADEIIENETYFKRYKGGAV